jgi:hypothetical protein
VHTILLPEFYDNQEGTLHFRYLLDGGLLRVARDLPSHVRQLGESLAQSDPVVHHNQAFIERFVRPSGLTRASTPLFADAVERVAAMERRPHPQAMWAWVLRLALTPIARRTTGTFREQPARQRRFRAKARARDEKIAALIEQRAREKAELLESRRIEHQRAARERQENADRIRVQKLEAKAQARAAKLQAKEARIKDARRRKQRAALNERVSGYLRRLARHFSATR